MRTRMTQEAACDYLLKWLIRPVYFTGDSLYYETPVTTFRVSGSLMEYRQQDGMWLTLSLWGGDFNADEVIFPSMGKWITNKLYLELVTYTALDIAIHSIVLTSRMNITSFELFEPTHFQQVFEGIRVLAGLDSPQIYIDFLLDSLEGNELQWLESALRERS